MPLKYTSKLLNTMNTQHYELASTFAKTRS
jgi:hypothetical protein